MLLFFGVRVGFVRRIACWPPLKPQANISARAAKRSRRNGLLSLLLAGIVIFWRVVSASDPLWGWPFFRYARAAGLALVFAASCVVAGHALLVRVLARLLPIEEQLALAFSFGVLLFFLASFSCGLLGLYGLPCFLMCPALLLACGARSFLRYGRRFFHHARHVDLRLRLTPLRGVVLALGCLGILVLWLPTLTPQNVMYDARWYHLPIAESYVAQGRIAPFREGWTLGAYPQLASLLYAWAFSAPGSLFDHVETAAQLEFAIFLGTLVGVVAIVRRVLGKREPLAWAAVFLFPVLFCYDSGLSLGADHVAALWAAPIFLLAMRYRESPSPGYALLLAGALAGALNTKYSAINLLPLPLVIVLSCTWRDLRRGSKAGRWIPPLICGLGLAVLTAPHWLKNLVYYGDPLFPLLRGWLGAHPWSEAAEAPYRTVLTLRHPAPTMSAVGEMLKTLATFSFAPHEYPQFHGTVPIFGSLFTLSTPLLILLQARRRRYWLFAGAYLGIAAWFWVHQFDRYLQDLVPWMAAATATVLIDLWQEGGVVRLTSTALVALQGVWAAAVPFFPTHLAGGPAILSTVVELLGKGYTKQYDQRFAAYPEWEAVARALPRDAKVLVHEEDVHLGLGRASVLDNPGDQGALYWGEPAAATPAQIWRLLRAHGVSHVLWAKNLDHGSDTVAGGLAFFDFVAHYTHHLDTRGGFALAALSEMPPPDSAPGLVAFYPCDADPVFAPGLYDLEAMARAAGDRRPVATATAGVTMSDAIGRAQFLVFDVRCHPLPREARERFQLLAARGASMLMSSRTTEVPVLK